MTDPVALPAEYATVRHEALAYLASDHDSRLRAHRFAAAVVGLTEPVAGNTREQYDGFTSLGALMAATVTVLRRWCPLCEAVVKPGHRKAMLLARQAGHSEVAVRLPLPGRDE